MNRPNQHGKSWLARFFIVMTLGTIAKGNRFSHHKKLVQSAAVIGT
jgi:hypothetical protein